MLCDTLPLDFVGEDVCKACIEATYSSKRDLGRELLQRLLGQWKLDEGLSSGRGRICRIDQWNIIL